ncbi:TIGR04141 family sporadically distributed protein [Microbispora sp. NBC_01189]|nr:TIGR04141 family sporadically distributed protein [Microbispora sp. NBC_01189]
MKSAQHEPAETRKTTLYRLHETGGSPDELRNVLAHRYLEKDGFTAVPVTVGGIPGLLVHGTISRGVADWCAVVEKLTGADVQEENSTSAAVLLIEVGGVVYALSYGMGFLLVDPRFIDPGFGLSFAVRAVNPEQVRQVTHIAMVAQPRYERSSVPGGQNIRFYGVEEYGEIVGKITGQLAGFELTFNRGRKRRISVAGTDSLKIHLGTNPADLIDDLRRIGEVCEQESPLPQLDFIAQLRALGPRDYRVSRLNDRLDDLLGGGSDGELALALPLACHDIEETQQSYRIKIGPERYSTEEDLTLEAILELTGGLPPGQRLKSLRNGYIQVCADADGQEPLSRQVRGNLWVAADVPLDSRRYFYHEGKWYEIGTNHLETIRRRVEEVLTRPPSISLPPWTSNLVDEDAYNKEAAKHGFVLLDKRKIYPPQHPHGIEACDLLGGEIELIHVKAAAGSGPLSHLFRQGMTSFDALRFASEAREELVKLVQSVQPIDPGLSPKKVIFAIALVKTKKKGQAPTFKRLTVGSLFTFSQVSLVHTLRMLELAGVEVEVIDISPQI